MASLYQLILMLSSDQDGEVLAAVRAVGKALSRDGRDWHWLAEHLTEGPPIRHVAGGDGWEACDVAAQLLKAGAGQLSQWEIDFLNDMTFWSGPATDRQDAVLRRIADKLRWRP